MAGSTMKKKTPRGCSALIVKIDVPNKNVCINYGTAQPEKLNKLQTKPTLISMHFCSLVP